MEKLKVVELTTQRKGEIALALLVRKGKGERMSLTKSDVMKTIGRVLQKIQGSSVTKDELVLLYRWIIAMAIKDSFGTAIPENEPEIGLKRAEEIALLIYENADIIREIPLDKDELQERIFLLAAESSDDFAFSADELFSLFREKVYSDIKKIFS